jgi:NADP-dependent aldehyde dehydrogenase
MTASELTGSMFIGAERVRGGLAAFNAIDPSTGEAIEPSFGGGGAAEVDRACDLAWAAFDAYRDISLAERAAFLETIAAEIMALGDALIDRSMRETGLARGRLETERARTVYQLRLFAETVREGNWINARIDPAQPERQPMPRSDLRQRHIPLGPVAVFGASNFPLAFSVAGGDTSAALAAGCPVVVKAHPAHPGTSELVASAVQNAVRLCGLPEGVFSMLIGIGNEIGTLLVTHPAIKAVGFTGSRGGGLALMRAAAARPEPIPVYAEMSSINPVFLLPHALSHRAEQIGREFVASVTLGAGQFCTNPGLVFGIAGPDLDAFIAAAASALGGTAAATMLTPGIASAYNAGVLRLEGAGNVRTCALGREPTGPNQGRAALFVTDAATFSANHALEDEVFGATSLVIVCPDLATMKALGEKLDGQLTATLQMDPADLADARVLLPMLERRVGRILVNGFPTGVEVCHAMVHGGPFPATSDGRSTSVGTLAMMRFLRPVCYQDFPQDLLPASLGDANALDLWRSHDGHLAKA